jgi:DNA mismatch repair protein MutL
MQRSLPELAALGFEISELGGGSYAVNGVPAGLEGMNPTALVRSIVADAAQALQLNTDSLHETMALSMARQAAIPQGQVLSNEEMERVVNELFACSNVNYTPDGKTILAIMPQQDIEKLLG